MMHALCALISCLPLPQDIDRGPTVNHYTVRASSAEEQDGIIPLDLALRVENPPRSRAVFQIPVWTPGSYRYRDFPDDVHHVRAVGADGAELDVLRLNRHSYEVAHGDQTEVTLHYRIALEEGDRFMLPGDERRCITYEGPAVYMYEASSKGAPCHVTFELPEGWSAASGLVARDDGSYFAQDYDFLADCPVKIGLFQRFEFESHRVPIEVVVDGPGDVEFDHETWLANIKKITDCQGEMFGGFPFDRYTFLYTASPFGGGGGLEHLTSTAIGIPVRSLRSNPNTGMGVTAHEFFHLWNVKRIRARALGPFDYTRANRTTALWLHEGITSYYTDVTLARCGLKSTESFYQGMAGQIQSYESTPGRPHVSSAMASYTVWEPSPRDRSVNYYNSGQVLGFLLDLEIRHRTENRRSLDDFMRDLYELCKARGAGFDDHELAALASAATGSDMRPWFDRYVTGTVVPDYATVLGHAGLDYTERRSSQKSLRGVGPFGRGRDAYYVSPDASGQRAVSRGGRVVVMAGEDVDDTRDIDRMVEDLEVGAVVRLELETFVGGSRFVDTVVVESPRVRASIKIRDDAPESAVAIREGIVTGVPRRPGR